MPLGGGAPVHWPVNPYTPQIHVELVQALRSKTLVIYSSHWGWGVSAALGHGIWMYPRMGGAYGPGAFALAICSLCGLPWVSIVPPGW